MIHDVESGFLPEELFQELSSRAPSADNWKPANVFSKKTKKNLFSPENRMAYKVAEDITVAEELIETIHEHVMRVVRSMEGFVDGWIRPDQVEWVRYDKDGFFNLHCDFERYRCNGMTPFTLMIGMTDTVLGGETIVEKRLLKGSTRKNGMVLFPSNVLHEGKRVLRGEKMCLKLELLVFLTNDTTTHITVRDETSSSISYWHKEGLDLVDNFITSKMRFEKDTSDVVIVSDDVSAGLKDSMIRIGFGSRIGDDFMFPLMSNRTMHNLLIAMDFLADPSRDIVMCACPIVWDIINRRVNMEERGVAACVVAWHTTETTDPSWFLIRSSCGRSDPGKEEDTFLPFDVLAGRVVRASIKSLDMYPDTELRYGKGEHAVQEAMPACVMDSAVLCTHIQHTNRFFPSDRLFQPDVVQGDVHKVSYEMCNDSERGYESYEYEEYTSFLFYPRWVLVRPALIQV